MDWKSLIAQLQAAGLSQPQIAARCGCGQATISDLASGKTSDPRHSLGQALQALLDEVRQQAVTPVAPIPPQPRTAPQPGG